MTMRPVFDCSVYFVADPSLCSGRAVTDVVRAALQGGVTMIQYRDKSGTEEEILRTAKALKDITQDFQVPLIINDHVELALEAGADGVHLGQGDMNPQQAREVLGPSAIIGQTAFTPEQIGSVDPAITDYIGVGPFYPTKTDKGKPVLGPKKFAALAADAPVPVVGIGGIVPDNAAAVIAAGAAGVAMMRALSEADDPALAAQHFVQAVEHARLRKAS